MAGRRPTGAHDDLVTMGGVDPLADKNRRCTVPGVVVTISCGARIRECGCDLLLFVYWPRLSGGDLILVREAAEDLLSADAVPGEVELR